MATLFKMTLCCLFLWWNIPNTASSFDPERDGVVSPTETMAVVMKSGFPDMRTLQAELDDVIEEEEREDGELDATQDGTEVPAGEQGFRKKRFILNKKDRQWTRGIVPYKFSDNLSKKARVNILTKVFATFEYWTHFRFIPWNDTVPEVYGLDHRNYLIFVRSTGCWSSLGNQKKSKGQKISCCMGIECLHELGHALGFYHQHTSPLRENYIRINYRNIQPGRSVNFLTYSKTDSRELFGYYDMSSVMSYHTTAFSKNLQETITVLDPDMKFMLHLRDTKDFYMFYEVEKVYDMKAEKCPGFKQDCSNGGYVSYIDGQCRCRCPVGLDHRTGCNTHIGADIWPPGSYSVLRGPHKHCPSGFEHGKIVMSPTSAYSSNHANSIYFCTKTYDSERDITIGQPSSWFNGNYCVYSTSAACPAGFTSSYSTYTKSSGLYNISTLGTTPKMVQGSPGSLKLVTCCRQSEAAAGTMTIPTWEPIVLTKQLKDARDRCTTANGMDVVTIPNQWIQTDSGDSLAVCIYLPRSASYDKHCGDFVHLSEANNQIVLSSPSFPSLYSSTSPCTWFVKGPPESKLALDFSTFDVEKDSKTGRCKSYIEIRYMLPGQPGIKYCGQDFPNTIVSHGNTLGLTLGILQQGGSFHSRFQASVRLIQEEDMCYTNNGLDNSYQGTVNYGHNFEPCIPWDRATNCRHHLFNNTDFDLESNYCRNPGHGTAPWCYTDAETCARVYCDVCKFRRCYDLFDDCRSSVRSDPQYCSTDPEAVRGCRETCGWCMQHLRHQYASRVTCNQPGKMVGHAYLLSVTKSIYYVGDVVTYVCSSKILTQPGSAPSKVNSTCSSEGTWTPVANKCSSTCINKRQDCGLLIQRNPTMCYDYLVFSKQNCLQACGFCGLQNSIRPTGRCFTNATTIANITTTTSAPYLEGDTIAHACNHGYVHVTGDLQRSCLSDGSITGTTPSCVSINDTSTNLYTVDIRRRTHVTQPGKIYTISNDVSLVARDGQIERWQYYSMFGGSVTFMVWRRMGNESRFLLVGKNTVQQWHDDRIVSAEISSSERITVKPGDFIGIKLPSANHAGISVDRCKPDYNPEGFEKWVVDNTRQYKVGNTYQLREGNKKCNILSINAVISPQQSSSSSEEELKNNSPWLG